MPTDRKQRKRRRYDGVYFRKFFALQQRFFGREVDDRFNKLRVELGRLRCNGKRCDADYKFHNKIAQLQHKINKLFGVAMGRYVQEVKYGQSINFKNFAKLKEDDYLPLMERDKYKKPCEVCGETRVHNFAHLIPYSEGGGAELGNLLHLCANHHKLFDDRVLTNEEWKKIDFHTKSDASREYAERIIQPRLKARWKLLELNKLKRQNKITEEEFEKRKDKLEDILYGKNEYLYKIKGRKLSALKLK